MTDFIDSFSDQALVPSWKTTGSRHWAFVIDAAPGCMQDYLDSHFNAPGPDKSPYRYEALSEHNFGILMVTDHPDFACCGEDRDGWDTVAHRELFWQFPAHRYKDSGNGFAREKHDLVWIQPFYFDDNSTVMFASREIIGSEKQMAEIGFEEGTEADDLHLDVAIQGFKTFNPRSRSHLVGVLHIELRQGTDEVDFAQVMDSGEATSRQASERVDLSAFLERKGAPAFLGTWMGTFPALAGKSTAPSSHPATVHIDTLKQYRDAFDMRKAAYRAIIASKATHTQIRNPRFFKGRDVDLAFAWSDTMKEQFTRLFGLDPNDATDKLEKHGFAKLASKMRGDDRKVADWELPITKKEVLFAVAFESDATFEVLETLHTYGAGIFSR
ncbi:hypothetical protein [Erythrobacter sp. SD-21]|uniref:hypothetical protein n=1 Tax=Erythrobacter sp. SD-21 TaxID=161528 RepID=UPI000153FAF9|nr:hypothetical protein [Erythrobacter sp. SD-21]EDL49988.1 hypothetical protein ED21_25993 [Erythrobacter sp. SD-21]